MYEGKTYRFRMKPIFERYYSEDTNWGVFEFETEDDIPELESHLENDWDNLIGKNYVISKRQILVGKMQHIYIGSTYMAEATLEYDSKYRKYQYNAISIVSVAPKSYDEQLVFLETITSENLARNILAGYPDIIQDAIDGSLDDIDYRTIKGMSERNWSRIKDSITENYVVSDIIVMLQPIGVTYTMIRKLLMHYKSPALLKQQLETNPYILTEVRGLGFKKVDRMALELQPELIDSRFRLQAYITYYLQETGENDGHTYVRKADLRANVDREVSECSYLFDELIEHNCFLHVEDDRIGLKSYYDTEMDILEYLKERMKHRNDRFSFSDEYIDKIIDEVENELGFRYTNEQLREIKSIINDEVSFISGKAGTGKTSIMRAILRIYKNKGFDVRCCALAAKAAQVIIETTGCNASTIHYLLGSNGSSFRYNENNHLDTDVLFLDEASMCNANLIRSVLIACDYRTRIIICGDHMQLPPIGYGNAFSDLLQYDGLLNIHMLTKVMRQAMESGVIADANKIREGRNPISKPELRILHGRKKDMCYMFREDREQLRNIAIDTYMNIVKEKGADDVQILVPRKSNCINSTKEINRIIQERLVGKNKSISNGFTEFHEGARVRHTKNNRAKGINNGEIGYIRRIRDVENAKGRKEQIVEVEYRIVGEKKSKTVEYSKSDLNELDLAYAITCHSAQGSGYGTIIGIIDNTHYILLDNCMLYTTISRTKDRCLLLAEPDAFLKAVRTTHSRRNTWLSLYKYKYL